MVIREKKIFFFMDAIKKEKLTVQYKANNFRF
jgi:hypothetical protein